MPPSSLTEHELDSPEYWAFISYRHADNLKEGRQWATWLHQAIETYEVPSDLVGTENPRGEIIPERIFPIFRDEEELAADSDLAGPIYTALDSSKYLVVICSPRAVMSQYVVNEISYFKRDKSDRVLAMMIDGEPGAEGNEERAAAGIEECFPLPLRYVVDEHAQLTDEPEEPIAADFRLMDEHGNPRQGWTNPEAYRRDLFRSGVSSKEADRMVAEYGKTLDSMKLKVIAGIIGVPLGTLTQRDKAYQLMLAEKRARTLRLWLAAVMLLALAAIGGGALAWMQKQEADNYAKKAAESLSNSLASEGLNFLAKGETEEGLAYLDASLREWPDNSVPRQRFLYELLYRNWTIPARVLTAPQAFGPKDAAAKQLGQSDQGFKVVDAGEDGSIKLEQWIGYKNTQGSYARLVREATYRPATHDWVLANERKGPPDKRVRASQLTLRNGTEIVLTNVYEESAAHSYGMHEALKDGVQAPFIGSANQECRPSGIFVVNNSQSHILFASSGAPANDDDSIKGGKDVALTFYDAKERRQVHQHVIRTDGTTELADIVWDEPHVIVTSVTHSRDAERIDVLEVGAGGTVQTKMIIEGYTIKDRPWAWHQGGLYVLAVAGDELVPSLAIYRPMKPAMSLWTAREYDGSELIPFKPQNADPLALGFFLSRSGREASAVYSPSGEQIAFTEDGSHIKITNAQGRTLSEVTTEKSTTGRNMWELAFSPNEESLLTIGRVFPPFGDSADWELFDISSGRQVLPVTSLAYWTGEPEKPSDGEILAHFDAFAWTADQRCLALRLYTENGDPPKLNPGGAVMGRKWPDSLDARYGELAAGHVAVPSGHEACLIHPIVLSRTACPSWFLDLSQHLYRVKKVGVSGMAQVPFPNGSFREAAERAAETDADSDYTKFARMLAEVAAQATSRAR